jgi:hypothetical protein
MALSVPEQQRECIQKFLELPDDGIARFLQALETAGTQFNVFDLSDQIAERSELPLRLTAGIIQVLQSLYLTRDAAKPIEPIDKFLDGAVFNALRDAGTFSSDNNDARWQTLRGFLLAALSLERTLGTAVKAGVVQTQHERIFCDARIMTDIRPIFHFDVSEKPESALLIHMLRITQRNSRDSGGRATDDLYFALDTNDIKVLESIVDRALEKEKTLRSSMASAGITVLDPKAIY